ncbi:MAG: CHAD domain-containing protein, partial [Aquabacterium sp.]|nr:CHAD domain-containing protein [Aquabacterium sp.]
AAPALRPALGAALASLHRQVRRDAARFSTLDEARRHRLRRRIKRLRYATELSAALWPAKATAAFLRRLQRAQTALGDDQDALMAMAQYRSLAASDPRAWFAVGWLTAHRAVLAGPCDRALARLARQPAPWRKG